MNHGHDAYHASWHRQMADPEFRARYMQTFAHHRRETRGELLHAIERVCDLFPRPLRPLIRVYYVARYWRTLRKQGARPALHPYLHIQHNRAPPQERPAAGN